MSKLYLCLLASMMLSGISSAVDYDRFEYSPRNYTATPSGSILEGDNGVGVDDVLLDSEEAGMRIGRLHIYYERSSIITL